MTRRGAALLLVTLLALASMGCGARLSKEQMNALASRQVGTGAVPAGPAATTPGAGSGAAPATTVPGTGPATGQAAAAAPGAADPSAAGGTAACAPAPGSTDPGVTDTEIKLGNVSTISGPVPGFGETGRNGAKAYLNYVNETQGGVCGRKLSLVTADDRLDAGQSRAATEQLASQVLGFVGGTTVVDNGAAAAINGTNIANTALAIGDAAISSPNFFSPNPIDPSGTTSGTAAMWAYFKRTRNITKVAVIYPAQTDARSRALAYIPDIQSAGLAIDGPYEVAIAETNYTGVVTKMKNDGADAFITALEINGMSRLAQAMQQVDYKAKAAFFGAQAYGKDFLRLAGSAAEGASIGLAYSMFEDAPSVPAVQAFLEWYARTNPGSNPDFFSVMGWAAADMMVQALEAAGATPTRDKVLAALQSFHAFDAHGVIAPCDPAGKRASPQFLIAVVSGGAWRREFPDAGFATGS
jgi:ABC-type branched-subunit amino acid transport system substrate-binding protein